MSLLTGIMSDEEKAGGPPLGVVLVIVMGHFKRLEEAGGGEHDLTYRGFRFVVSSVRNDHAISGFDRHLSFTPE